MFSEPQSIKRYINVMDLDAVKHLGYEHVALQFEIQERDLRQWGNRLGYDLPTELGPKPWTHRQTLFDFLIVDPVGHYFLNLAGAVADPGFINLNRTAGRRSFMAHQMYRGDQLLLAFMYDLPMVVLCSQEDITNGLPGWGVNENNAEEGMLLMELAAGFSAFVYTEMVRRGLAVGDTMNQSVQALGRGIVVNWVRAVALRSRSFQLYDQLSSPAVINPQAREYEIAGMTMFSQLQGGVYDRELYEVAS